MTGEPSLPKDRRVTLRDPHIKGKKEKEKMTLLGERWGGEGGEGFLARSKPNQTRDFGAERERESY